MKPKWMLQDGAGDGTDGGGGGSADNKGGGEGKDKGAGDQMQKNMEMMMRGMAVLAKSVSETQASLKELAEGLKKPNGDDEDEDDDGDGDRVNGEPSSLFGDTDLEQLGRKDFAALILTKFDERLQHHLRGAMKPFDEKLTAVSSRLEGDLADRQIAEAKNGRPDFMEWRHEIAALVKENPGLNVVRAYTLARSENAAKAKEMDEKYKKAEEKPRFSGFLPTGGTGDRGGDAKKLKFNEAAEKAWNDVMSELGGAGIEQLPVVGGQH